MSDMLDTSRRDIILQRLHQLYPGKESYDLDGRGLHFVCEVEPVSEHAEYDTAVEIITRSKPHKHLKMVQRYRVLLGHMELNVDDKVIRLSEGESFVVLPGKVHWATSDDESLVELYSVPGWTKEDHIVVSSAGLASSI